MLHRSLHCASLERAPAGTARPPSLREVASRRPHTDAAACADRRRPPHRRPLPSSLAALCAASPLAAACLLLTAASLLPHCRLSPPHPPPPLVLSPASLLLTPSIPPPPWHAPLPSLHPLRERSPRISPHLPTSPHASLWPQESEVATSVVGTDFAKLTQTLHDVGCFDPHYPDEAFKLDLPAPPRISPYLPTSPLPLHISPHLPASPRISRSGLQARPHAAARIPRLLPAAERHAGARILPDRFLVLHVWVGPRAHHLHRGLPGPSRTSL